jgi:hypothetical protein
MVVFSRVDSLKWEASPRQVCSVMSATSAPIASANERQNHGSIRLIQSAQNFPSATKLTTHPTESIVTPSEKPKRIGLRQETGPSHEPRSPKNTTK